MKMERTRLTCLEHTTLNKEELTKLREKMSAYYPKNDFWFSFINYLQIKFPYPSKVNEEEVICLYAVNGITLATLIFF